MPGPGVQVAGSIVGSGHIAFVEIWSWNYFYGHFLPTADSSRSWRKYGHSTGYPRVCVWGGGGGVTAYIMV